MQLPQIVEAAYTLFAPYTIGQTLDVCKACCVTDAEEKELVGTPLRSVSRDLLDYAYYSSARNYSDRELGEMKHFLPRVLEMVAEFEFPCHSTEITFTRLDLDKAEQWPPAERTLLDAFATAFFRKCLVTYPLPNGEDLGSSLVTMFGNAHFDLPALLAQWAATETTESLLHFKDLVLHDISYKATVPFKMTNAFTTEAVSNTVINWLNNSVTKSLFAGRIERVILEVENEFEAKTMEELSWVYELLHGKNI